MKKIVKWVSATLVMSLLSVVTLHAQGGEAKSSQLSKEQKAKLKQLKEDNLAASFKEAGLTEEQTKQAKEAIEAANQKSNELKADTKLADGEKEEKKKAINDEKNNKLKQIMGDKYKVWSTIRKKHKEAEASFGAEN